MLQAQMQTAGAVYSPMIVDEDVSTRCGFMKPVFVCSDVYAECVAFFDEETEFARLEDLVAHAALAALTHTESPKAEFSMEVQARVQPKIWYRVLLEISIDEFDVYHIRAWGDDA